MNCILATPTPAHLDHIAAIWEAGWHEAHAAIVPASLTALRTSESFRARSEEHRAHTRIAKSGRNVVGFCMVKDDEVYQMYVSPEARGTGAAGALLADAEARILASGFPVAWLACAIGNHRAAAFYEKSGWLNTGQKVVELDGPNGGFPLNVWRFEKQLSGFEED